MDSILKSEKAQIEALGRVVMIRELSAKAFVEVVEAHKDGRAMEASAIACRYGVVEWAGESVDDIMSSLTPIALNEIADKVMSLSKVYEKNLESDQSGDSSFVSR